MNARRNAAALVLAFATIVPGLSGAAAADDERRGWGDPCRDGNDARSSAIYRLYERRDQAPVWLTRDGRTPSGYQLVRLLRTAEEGVMTDCLARALTEPDGPYSRGALDVMLTDAWLELHVRRAGGQGDLEDRLAPLLPGERERRQRHLQRLAESGTGADQSPGADAGARMAAALERYRRIADQGGWPEVGPGTPLNPGDSDPRVPSLRERLAATGDLETGGRGGDGNRYAGRLVEAVIGFQQRHGLAPDGVVGEATRKALDVPARQRVALMEINLRRIEARAIDDDAPVVRVNIPDFRVTLHEKGRVTFSTRAIVGRPEHQTPQMKARITALTLNPAWYVPRTVLRDDLAPRFARDNGYAERHGFHAANSDRPLDAFDWSGAPMVPVRQAPGPTNALGRIKFEMPNRQAIYLHDTPSRHLFESRRRAFSAGCVRVEEPMELAARLTGVDADRLEDMAGDGETRTLRLGWRIPVQLVYFTAWVDESGRVQFRPDIYGRDDLPADPSADRLDAGTGT
ncbi:L,D-transpeptidase family protein [Halofilum ochraceum]|uniref:L,D-transpeptidase family protein n=1 Tax=Halofilum ochraceum TaxID=1611323 RepID=UPI0008DB1545|nr:L,D-transpeptidase family protein [Halofilum ochraceum]